VQNKVNRVLKIFQWSNQSEKRLIQLKFSSFFCKKLNFFPKKIENFSWPKFFFFWSIQPLEEVQITFFSIFGIWLRLVLGFDRVQNRENSILRSYNGQNRSTKNFCQNKKKIKKNKIAYQIFFSISSRNV